MKLPPISSYAPNFPSHPADARTQVTITPALTPVQSAASDRIEQFIQAGFAKATALLDQITSSDKPPTLDQLTRYINALTRLATARNAAPAANPKTPPIKSAPISNSHSIPVPQSALPIHRPLGAKNAAQALPPVITPTIPHSAQSTSHPPASATSPAASTSIPAASPTSNLPHSVNSEPSVVEIPRPSHPHPGLYRSEAPKMRYKMVLGGTPDTRTP